jgi:hypothetical protein
MEVLMTEVRFVRFAGFRRERLDNGELGPPIPFEDSDYTSELYFWMQRYKKELRLQFLEDIKRMIAEGANTDELMARLVKHERARRTMREGYDQVGNNEPKWDLDTLSKLCDEYGIGKFKEALLYTQSNLKA